MLASIAMTLSIIFQTMRLGIAPSLVPFTWFRFRHLPHCDKINGVGKMLHAAGKHDFNFTLGPT